MYILFVQPPRRTRKADMTHLTTVELPSDNTLRFAPGARVHQKRNTRIYGYVREIRPHAAKGTSYAIWWSNTCSVGDGWCDHDLA